MAGSFGTLDWSLWLRGLISGFVSGGASAVVSGFTVSAVDPDHFNAATPKFYGLIAAVFLSSGVLSALNFLKQQPLPPTTTVTTTIDVKQDPLPPKVTTITQETKVTPQ
jgi:hypothetical protein